jgi:hypothetical protein
VRSFVAQNANGNVDEDIGTAATREVEQHVSGASAKMSRVGVEFSRNLL